MITIKILAPKLTGCTDREYEIFNIALQKELKKYTNNVILLELDTNLFEENLDSNCAVVIYNYDIKEDNINEYIKEFITDAKNNNTKLYPVAMKKKFRSPGEIIGETNSFDIYEQLVKRGISDKEEYLQIGLERIGKELARFIIGDMQPVLTQKEIKCFLSHKRTDGEDIAREVDYMLKSWGEKSFRDLNDIKVGTECQKIIRERLRESDTVIFFDTPDVSESKWVKEEIETAQLFHIPIVWVKMHNGKSFIEPADKPHVSIEDFSKDIDRIKIGEYIDVIYEKAFELHRMNRERVLGYISSLKKLKDTGILDKFEQVDDNQNIYKIEFKRNTKRYKEMPYKHFVQFFGRRPTLDDKNALNKKFIEKHYNCENICGAGYDVAALLGPFSDINMKIDNIEPFIVDGAQEYVSEVRRLTFNRKIQDMKSNNIIISGAFPNDIDTIYQQLLIDAVTTFTKVIFDRGCGIIFGSHPTFTPLILNMGKDRLGEARKEKTKMYMSRFFEEMYTEEELNGFRSNASFIFTDKVEDINNKDESIFLSLTKMRAEMIINSNAAALIVIGGKTSNNCHNPGVDEEIEFAKNADIPVFIIGAAGGRAYEIAADYNNKGWKIGKWIPNGLQSNENRKLLISTEFEELVDMILTNLLLSKGNTDL